MKLAQKIAIGLIRAKLSVIAVISKPKAAEAAMKIFSTPFRKTKKQTPPVFRKAEKLAFKLDGNMIRGHRWNAGKETRVLIVHGFESSSKNFDRYITPLVKQGNEVFAFDAPAHGGSGGRQINLLSYVQMLREIHSRYGPFQAYLSHSFGGLAVTHFLETVQHDENVRLVLIAPTTESTSAIDSFFRILRLGIDIRKEFDELIVAKSGESPAHFSVRRAIKNIQAKILWFHDEGDELTPFEDAMRVKEENHPHIEFVITKGLGHRKIYRENKVVRRVVDFMNGER